MVFPPEGAITTREDLENIIVLGLPVEIWDIDMNKITTEFPISIEKSGRGLVLNLKDRKNTKYYLKWFGFKDPSYDALSVVQSVFDEALNHVNVYPASAYMFNSRDEAVQASNLYVEERRKKNAEHRTANH